MGGLRDANLTYLTAIQRSVLPHALYGRDIFGTAKTGSGKTLAFLVPLIENMYRNDWIKIDGIGGIIITPTRELAVQLIDELWKVGKYHSIDAGILIGGRKIAFEEQKINAMNVLFCTPGRLLQHIDQTTVFKITSLKVLILDEADRILDLGFTYTLNAIIEGLPYQRQTMLFSATQRKSIKTLVRLSLKNLENTFVHSDSISVTPITLKQFYIVCKIQEKIDIIWSFIKTHLKTKTIIFFATCKQANFIFELFSKLQPGVSVRCLNSKMKQFKRLKYEFCESKYMILIATDLASRGLDFPAVDWILQADCPENIPQYIHRVGRTARYTRSGNAVMLLLPKEKDIMLPQLRENKITITQLLLNKFKIKRVTPALQALISENTILKLKAEKSVTSYYESILSKKNKNIISDSELTKFAISLGLASLPTLAFIKSWTDK